MKLVRASHSQFQFQLGKREKVFLAETLKHYPCIPSAHQRLSRSGKLPEPEANQHLLDEALAEQRAENKKKVLAFLARSERFTESPAGFLLKLAPGEIDWLLQVLNDVRVGSWLPARGACRSG